MSQLNMQVTRQFQIELRRLMQARGIHSKSEAIRRAVSEALERTLSAEGRVDYLAWVGMAEACGQNPSPRFKTHDDLWESAHGD